MRVILSFITMVFVSGFFLSHAEAVIISLDHASLFAQGISSSHKREVLETKLNELVFNPHGITFEVGATTGGTPAVDDFSIEGTGLTIITGWGFVMRFDDNVSEVRARFSNYKDDQWRHLYAFDPLFDYTRSTSDFSQNPDGTPIGFTESVGSAIDFTEGEVPPGNDSSYIDLIVSDSQGRISSIWGDTDKFLTSLSEIEVTFANATVPEPTTIALLGIGLVGLAGGAVRRRRKKRADEKS